MKFYYSEAPSCRRCKCAMETYGVLLDGICDDCVDDKKHKQERKEKLYRNIKQRREP